MPRDDRYVSAAAQEAGPVLELADDWKSAKYTNLDTLYTFQPTAIQLGLINDFLLNPRHKISLQMSDDIEASCLYQRLSVVIQWFNTILLRHSFVQEN